MLDHVLAAVESSGVDRTVVVVGYQAEKVKEHVGQRGECVYQEEQLGTGHAVLQARRLLSGADYDALIVAGDVPLLTGDLLRELVQRHRTGGAAATLMSTHIPDPTGYGRILRQDDGTFRKIVEQADLSNGQEHIDEVNTGICCIRGDVLFSYLDRLRTDNAQGEYYLVDIFQQLCTDGHRVEVFEAPDSTLVMGVNDRAALAEATTALYQRTLTRLMEQGVTIVEPANTYVDAQVQVGEDTVIHPFSVIRGATKIGQRCELGPGADIVDCTLGDETVVQRSTLEKSAIGSGVTVGPYTHIRPNTEVADQARIGNYAELKNSRIGHGSKVSHHSYIGDTDIGDDVNMGAGVVTVNYDGFKKHRTVIEDGAFVGCNVNLIAPVRVGRGAYVAAGSTINRDVPPDTLGIGRSRQENKEGWVERWRRRQERHERRERQGHQEPSNKKE